MRFHGLKFYVWLGFLSFLSCRHPSQFSDYVSLVKDHCLVQNPSHAIPFEAPGLCKEDLKKVIAFDRNFDDLDQYYGDQKARILNALYFLLNHPTAVPLDKLMFGHIPANLFFPKTLQKLISEHPNLPFHHILFNYILSSTSGFKLAIDGLFSANEGGFYNPLDQSINLKLDDPTIDFESTLLNTMVLIHEAQHSVLPNHRVYCPELVKEFVECDEGSDSPHGFEVAYLWALLQGHNQSPYIPKELGIIAFQLFNEVRFIYGLPEEARPLRDDWYPWFGLPKNDFRLLAFPDFSYVALIKLEQLHLNFPEDHYTSLIKICPESTPLPTSDCSQALHDLIAQADMWNAVTQPTQNYVSELLYLLLHHPFSAQGKLLGKADPELLFSDTDILMYSLVAHQKNVNQWLFDFVVNALLEDSHWTSIFYLPRPLPPNPKLPLSPKGQQLWDLKQNLLPWVLSSHPIVSYFILPNTVVRAEVPSERVNRFELIVLWALIKGQLALPKVQRSLTDGDLATFQQAFCDQVHRLGQDPLPAVFADLPTLSCVEINARL